MNCEDKTSAKTNGNSSALKKKLLSIEKTVLSESSSSIVWFHRPAEKRFVTKAGITLIDSSDHDFMSPDLGKLCEKFLKL